MDIKKAFFIRYAHEIHSVSAEGTEFGQVFGSARQRWVYIFPVVGCPGLVARYGFLIDKAKRLWKSQGRMFEVVKNLCVLVKRIRRLQRVYTPFRVERCQQRVGKIAGSDKGMVTAAYKLKQGLCTQAVHIQGFPYKDVAAGRVLAQCQRWSLIEENELGCPFFEQGLS